MNYTVHMELAGSPESLVPLQKLYAFGPSRQLFFKAVRVSNLLKY